MSKLPNHQANQVQWVRHIAPYIQHLRDQTFVIAFGGEIFYSDILPGLARDCSLLSALGIRLVLVPGARPQVDAELARRGLASTFHREIRVTDADSLDAVIHATGGVRLELEACLSRGVPNSPMAAEGAKVVSGNYITAAPMGVVGGVDYQYTGRVRKVDIGPIRAHMAQGSIVLLSTCVPSPSGEIFSVTLEHLAEKVAIALQADKLVFLSNALPKKRRKIISEMTLQEAEDYRSTHKLQNDVGLYLPRAISACRQGVRRAHLLDAGLDGTLLLEFFTQSGVGTMITGRALARLRQAVPEDVSAVLTIIEPLESEGVLVRRGREQLELEINNFTVLEHDGVLLGCAALYPFPEEQAGELACLAVASNFRDQGHGELLLEHVEDRARQVKLKTLYALTTHTTHWFLERGFEEVPVGALPRKKQELYNYQRRSKVLRKVL